uniref:Uncharacterized protein n=1 Tax=Rhizophora mucronata TaxID=61149 RepID=A0A2P2P033_RHIMU
MNNPTKQQYCL